MFDLQDCTLSQNKNVTLSANLHLDIYGFLPQQFAKDLDPRPRLTCSPALRCRSGGEGKTSLHGRKAV